MRQNSSKPANGFILLLSARPFRYSTVATREEHTKSYKRLTIPNGTPVLLSVLCKQEYLSWLEYHEKPSP
jgi:hypothetical protein